MSYYRYWQVRDATSVQCLDHFCDSRRRSRVNRYQNFKSSAQSWTNQSLPSVSPASICLIRTGEKTENVQCFNSDHHMKRRRPQYRRVHDAVQGLVQNPPGGSLPVSTDYRSSARLEIIYFLLRLDSQRVADMFYIFNSSGDGSMSLQEFKETNKSLRQCKETK